MRETGLRSTLERSMHMQTTENHNGLAYIGLVLLVLATFACCLGYYALAAGAAW